MPRFSRVPLGSGTCPFCGMAVQVPHETQAACIAALHAEIGRTRDVLASLKPTGVTGRSPEEGGAAAAVRLALSERDPA
jgi:hypothetical protein